MLLANKNILLGVTGGIAAYKIPLLVRLLKKSGANVRVLLTPAAHRFVTAETLGVLSGNPVYTDFFNEETGEWNNHVELGIWPDLMVVAPATSNSISKMANGVADNLLLTTYLSARCPVLLAPAMDLDMYLHQSLKRNLDILAKDGCTIIEPETGELASGLVGQGRMAEPENIFATISKLLAPEISLEGKKILVTAGPTHENIDPVRFIGNYSTGKMGFAIAEAFLQAGAEVHLVTGPVALPDIEHVHMVRVNSAVEMLDACTKLFPEMDAAVMSAAVADYRPAEVATEKIKKKTEELHIHLVKNPDILATLGSLKIKEQVLVGFALETENELENAKEKLKRKNLDLIVLNSMRDAGAGFGHDTNKITLIDEK
ncbi:MAG: bifunctional phosphopantothenoylcysteine decarboxylase/phosphopantothenate--cysteine ligase CoaBC, partial [Bacteroidia bacterium]|nr:bifunctional phosphopantothenoylcysteine decarboxylase/phosphopantothenate--cysteine ligase CoaBC [Bacteroidia bacterium]